MDSRLTRIPTLDAERGQDPLTYPIAFAALLPLRPINVTRNRLGRGPVEPFFPFRTVRIVNSLRIRARRI